MLLIGMNVPDWVESRTWCLACCLTALCCVWQWALFPNNPARHVPVNLPDSE